MVSEGKGYGVRNRFVAKERFAGRAYIASQCYVRCGGERRHETRSVRHPQARHGQRTCHPVAHLAVTVSQ
jgi:hypothetical protein